MKKFQILENVSLNEYWLLAEDELSPMMSKRFIINAKSFYDVVEVIHEYENKGYKYLGIFKTN